MNWSGTTICQEVTIGKNFTMGVGPLVTKNVLKNTVYAGVPAKFIKNIK